MLIEHVHGLGHDRGANAKCSFDQTHLSPDPWLQAPCPGLPFAQGAHDLEALDRGVGCRHRFETTHGLDQQFELAMVGFEHVVQVFYLPVFGFQGELPFSFQLGDCDAVAGGLVGVEFRWFLPALQPAKGLSQKALRGFGAAGRREEEVDRVAPFVDRPVQVGPFAPNLDVGLIQTPARLASALVV